MDALKKKHEIILISGHCPWKTHQVLDGFAVVVPAELPPVAGGLHTKIVPTGSGRKHFFSVSNIGKNVIGVTCKSN